MLRWLQLNFCVCRIRTGAICNCAAPRFLGWIVIQAKGLQPKYILNIDHVTPIWYNFWNNFVTKNVPCLWMVQGLFSFDENILFERYTRWWIVLDDFDATSCSKRVRPQILGPFLTTSSEKYMQQICTEILIVLIDEQWRLSYSGCSTNRKQEQGFVHARLCPREALSTWGFVHVRLGFLEQCVQVFKWIAVFLQFIFSASRRDAPAVWVFAVFSAAWETRNAPKMQFSLWKKDP